MIDKTKWPAGPWMDEPDHEEWTDEATGLRCMIDRDRYFGHLRGYVAVPAGHPLAGVGYDDGPNSKINVHGGLTYADHKQTTGLWWFGFDCNHFGDQSPSTLSLFRAPATTPHGMSLEMYLDENAYRDWGYVKSEVESLAKQLKEWPT